MNKGLKEKLHQSIKEYKKISEGISKKEKDKIKRNVNKSLLTFKEDNYFLVDTRERKGGEIDRIKMYFEKNNLHWIDKKLDTGDFSFCYKNNDYSSLFAIDRKKDLNEFIGNLFEYKKDADGKPLLNEKGKKIKSDRFHKELERIKLFHYFSFAIQYSDFEDIYIGNYRSQAEKNSIIGMIETIKNFCQIDFIGKINFGYYLEKRVYYYLRSKLIEEEIFKYYLQRKEK